MDCENKLDELKKPLLKPKKEKSRLDVCGIMIEMMFICIIVIIIILIFLTIVKQRATLWQIMKNYDVQFGYFESENELTKRFCLDDIRFLVLHMRLCDGILTKEEVELIAIREALKMN